MYIHSEEKEHFQCSLGDVISKHCGPKTTYYISFFWRYPTVEITSAVLLFPLVNQLSYLATHPLCIHTNETRPQWELLHILVYLSTVVLSSIVLVHKWAVRHSDPPLSVWGINFTGIRNNCIILVTGGAIFLKDLLVSWAVYRHECL